MAVSGLSPVTYLLAKSHFSGGFSAVSGLAAPKSCSRLVGKVVTTSAGFHISISGGNFTPDRVSTSGTVVKLRPSHPVPVT